MIGNFTVSFHWISVLKIGLGGALAQLPCQLLMNLINETLCDDLSQWGKTALSDSLWALKPIDASGKVPPGFFDGALNWDGSYKECLDVSKISKDQKSEFTGKYCWAEIPVSALANLRIATCMPNSCNNEDARTAYRLLSFGENSPISKVECIPLENPLSTSADTILFIIFVAAVGAISLLATAYDYFVYQDILRTAENPDQVFDNLSSFGKILLAFSFYTNGKKLFDMEQRPGQFHCLHGIRFFSMTWVIMGHTYLNLFGGDNVVTVLQTLPGKFINQVIVNATPSVDTFFLLSGFLLAFLWLKEMHKCQGKKLKSVYFWIMYYVHRYLRLTPLLAISIWFLVSAMPYTVNGPYWMPQNDLNIKACKENWWITLLYFNNVYKTDNYCFGVSWYLSNDMQFYVVAPIVLILLFLFPIIGFAVCGALMAILFAISAWITVDHDFPPTFIVSKNPNIPSDSNRLMYVPPWTRYGPYVIGVMLGYFMFYLSKRKRPATLSWLVVIFGWIIAAASGSAVIFGLVNYADGEPLSEPLTAFYAAVNRSVWALSVAWVIVACHLGYGGFIDTFLSYPVWIPLSRLTYAAYLIHTTFMIIFFGHLDQAPHWDNHLTWTMLTIGITIWSYMISVPFSCLFELPVPILEKVIFGESKPKRSEVTPGKT